MNKSITLMMIIAGAISWSSVAEAAWVVFANKSNYHILIQMRDSGYNLPAKKSRPLDITGQFTIYSFPVNGKIEFKKVGEKLDKLGIVYGKVDSNGNMKSSKTLPVTINDLDNLGIAIDVGVVTGLKVGYFDKTNPTKITYGN